MSIAPDQYVTVTPSNFLSKAHCTFAGQELFFFVNTLFELRVQVLGASISYVLDSGVKQVQILPAQDHVDVYYLTVGGVILYVKFQQLGSGVASATTNIQQTQNFSVFHSKTSTPPTYLLMRDDGIGHYLYVASDAAFLTATHTRVYNNVIDHTFYTFGPRLAMHPSDTKRLTVVCQRQTLSTGEINVGMYEILVPGVV